MNLADWLLEQIAADEEWARLFACADPHLGTELNPGCRDRVLAECAAKRKVVEFAQQCEDDERRWSLNGIMTARRGATFAVLRFLAQPYRDREGYRQGWDIQ